MVVIHHFTDGDSGGEGEGGGKQEEGPKWRENNQNNNSYFVLSANEAPGPVKFFMSSQSSQQAWREGLSHLTPTEQKVGRTNSTEQ